MIGFIGLQASGIGLPNNGKTLHNHTEGHREKHREAQRKNFT